MGILMQICMEGMVEILELHTTLAMFVYIKLQINIE